MSEERVTVERLKELISYDPITGDFRWIKSANKKIRINSSAGCVSKGRRRIRLDGKLYLASRLAWLYMTNTFPNGEVDHIDCNSLNDSWGNLREVDRCRNLANTVKMATNTSGFKGSSFDAKLGKWVAQISHENKRIYLGVWATKEEAHAAYVGAAVVLKGEYARWE